MLPQRRKTKTVVKLQQAEFVLRKHNIAYDSIRPSNISYTNKAFQIKSGNHTYYLKFFTDQWDNPSSGIQEIKAMALLKSLQIPAPNLKFFGLSDKDIPQNYALLDALPGKAIIDIPPTSLDAIILSDITSCLRTFTSITGPQGFLLHEPAIHRTYPTYSEFINDITHYAIQKLADIGFQLGNIPQIYQNWTAREPTPAIYCHHDFSGKHIFIHQGMLSGVIDFEWAIYGSPLIDPVQLIVSLAERGFPPRSLIPLLEYAHAIDYSGELPFYFARAYIHAAAWSHKHVDHHPYVQNCLSKCRAVLSDRQVTIEHVQWDKPPVEAEPL